MSELDKDVIDKRDCFHCGEPCTVHLIQKDNHDFCCNGCAQVYSILKENNLDSFYKISEKEGISQFKKQVQYFNYLDNEDIQENLIEFRTPTSNTITISLPQIHCSACIWILERLHRFNPAIISSRVNFVKKRCTVTYNPEELKLSEVAQILDSIGYTPRFNLSSTDENNRKKDYDKVLLYKIGVAGFCFGNIMLISFPDYLASSDVSLYRFFSILKILLALPVLFYAGRDYLLAGWLFLKNRTIGIDLPIAIGMAALFVRSSYEILLGAGEGYFDSFAGFVFLLLLGKWFQERTYANISFDLDYKSFFPISISKRVGDQWEPFSIEKLEKEDELLVRTNEIVPCDGQIIGGKAQVDYSFVTGEADAVQVAKGDQIFAGGKVLDGFLEVHVLKSVKQSRLTKLWNEDAFRKKEEVTEKTIIDLIGKYFVYIIVGIAILGFVYWAFQDIGKAFNVFTSILIIACPCVLALSIPFIYGNAVRHFSNHGIFLKNAFTLFRVQDLDTILFDKTGTITEQEAMKVSYEGNVLEHSMQERIASLTILSNHPKSIAITDYLQVKRKRYECENFREVVGQGIVGDIDGTEIKIGSASFCGVETESSSKSRSYVFVDQKQMGVFTYSQRVREGMGDVLKELRADYQLGLLSGDSHIHAETDALFAQDEATLYNQSPEDKLKYVEKLKNEGRKVMMIGDGLNDSGALMASQVGVVLSNNTNHFTPAADIVLSSDKFIHLPAILNFVLRFKKLLYFSFFFAILYNGVGLYFAIQGMLTPIVAAILMPISSLTIVLFGFIMSTVLSRQFINKIQ